ncbi:transcriptional regulator [Oceanobacillus neutriphilus]|uniref:Transcriptional regulator n=1 Tax=Oceanobacillus neutriphilus TaxID=531815 RepID=A0ABQ2P0H1_9BACI|nr:transcriptional regulator [Oceanobacillus neutriphilus]GGP14837.1 transcriptional regulator [Oceanobacillus neutriphilus]
MKQKPFFILTTHEQLKALSDPLRTQILTLLVEKSYTGQQLSQFLDLSRSKVHYHLGELEKNGLIQVVKTEVKSGITQKFFKAVALSFFPGEQLLPHLSEVGENHRQTTLAVLDRARSRILAAPETAFQMESPDPEEWARITMQMEVQTTREKFISWLAEYRDLIKRFDDLEDKAGEWYYLTTIGFEIDEPLFTDNTYKNPNK